MKQNALMTRVHEGVPEILQHFFRGEGGIHIFHPKRAASDHGGRDPGPDGGGDGDDGRTGTDPCEEWPGPRV
ncbi:hypothetical protein [Roseococcus sp.]|uniref:hypothetical protein n=1 Tax=Roseococcus sp. TaxID=2109646 RepID=UPI003BAB58F9